MLWLREDRDLRRPAHFGPEKRAVKAALVVASVFVQLAAGSPAWTQPKDHLNASDRELLGRLGDQVVGATVEPIDPAKLVEAMARPQSAEFRVIEGPSKGKTVRLSIRKDDRGLDGHASGKASSWIFEVPGIITEHVLEDPAGLRASHLVVGAADLSTTYQPPEPMLLRGVASGESKSYEMAMQVHPRADLKQTKYTGHIRVTYTNVGSYRIKTPAGVFDGVVVRTEYKGKLGPATMNDIDLRIYSPTVGLLALVTHDRLHAMMIINSDKHLTLLLEKPPEAAH